MIFTPLAPNAGPTGGEGFAAPPRICNLINPLISFAILNLMFKIYVLTILFQPA